MEWKHENTYLEFSSTEYNPTRSGTEKFDLYIYIDIQLIHDIELRSMVYDDKEVGYL